MPSATAARRGVGAGETGCWRPNSSPLDREPVPREPDLAGRRGAQSRRRGVGGLERLPEEFEGATRAPDGAEPLVHAADLNRRPSCATNPGRARPLRPGAVRQRWRRRTADRLRLDASPRVEEHRAGRRRGGGGHADPHRRGPLFLSPARWPSRPPSRSSRRASPRRAAPHRITSARPPRGAGAAHAMAPRTWRSPSSRRAPGRPSPRRP